MAEERQEQQGIDFTKQLAELEKHRASVAYRKSVAERFLNTAVNELSELDEQISLLREFLGFDESNGIKPHLGIIDDLEVSRLNLHPGRGDKVRRGALSVKEKLEAEEERAEQKKKEKEEERPNDKSRPRQPLKPGEKTEPEQPIKTPEERKEDIQKKLKEKDPREQKKGLEELKKPENKELGKDDPEFQKLVKDSEKRVQKFDKIRDSLRKNLRELMQSDSDVVKKNVALLRAGHIGMAVTGFKEIGKSTDTRFNSVAKAAKGLGENVEQLYKEFDIKPEEALSRETINDAKPIFTRQTGNKTREDVTIDRHSKQNRYLGESKELSDEERSAFKRIKDVYGVAADKLPPADAKTQRDMEIVRSIVHEDSQKPYGKIKPALIINATNDGR